MHRKFGEIWTCGSEDFLAQTLLSIFSLYHRISTAYNSEDTCILQWDAFNKWSKIKHLYVLAGNK